MTSVKSTGKILSFGPLALLYFLSISELDTNFENYFEILSFNIQLIIIYYWTLKRSDIFGSGHVFFAGIINDVVIGIPIGISSLCYLILCSVTAYLRNITLSPNFVKDWFSLLFTMVLVNSVQVIILDLIFLIKINYLSYLVNTGFTFLFYPMFFVIFNSLNLITYQTKKWLKRTQGLENQM